MIWQADGWALTLPGELASLGMDPLEQGGILIGLGSPWGARVTQFTRPGPLDLRLEGLFMMIDDSHQVELERSGLEYLGAWHSHPAGTPSEHSTEDLLDWRSTAPMMFAQQPRVLRLHYPIVTGDRLRVWALDRDLNLTELGRC